MCEQRVASTLFGQLLEQMGPVRAFEVNQCPDLTRNVLLKDSTWLSREWRKIRSGPLISSSRLTDRVVSHARRTGFASHASHNLATSQA